MGLGGALGIGIALQKTPVGIGGAGRVAGGGQGLAHLEPGGAGDGRAGVVPHEVVQARQRRLGTTGAQVEARHPQLVLGEALAHLVAAAGGVVHGGGLGVVDDQVVEGLQGLPVQGRLPVRRLHLQHQADALLVEGVRGPLVGGVQLHEAAVLLGRLGELLLAKIALGAGHDHLRRVAHLRRIFAHLGGGDGDFHGAAQPVAVRVVKAGAGGAQEGQEQAGERAFHGRAGYHNSRDGAPAPDEPTDDGLLGEVPASCRIVPTPWVNAMDRLNGLIRPFRRVRPVRIRAHAETMTGDPNVSGQSERSEESPTQRDAVEPEIRRFAQNKKN